MKKKWFYVESRICNELDNTWKGQESSLVHSTRRQQTRRECIPSREGPFCRDICQNPTWLFPQTLIQIMKVSCQDPLVIPDPKFHNSFTPFPKDAMSLANVLTKVVS
jgi:hypothetical protein